MNLDPTILVAGYITNKRRAAGARNLAYSLRIVEPTRTMTRAEVTKRDCIAFGTWKVAA